VYVVVVDPVDVQGPKEPAPIATRYSYSLIAAVPGLAGAVQARSTEPDVVPVVAVSEVGASGTAAAVAVNALLSGLAKPKSLTNCTRTLHEAPAVGQITFATAGLVVGG